MRFPVFLLILASALHAQSQYILNKKNDFWNGYSADVVCLNEARDSLTMVLREERTTIPLDTVGYLTSRERKSWGPYLLTASLVGLSTYTFFHFASRDDAMFTAEGKARFAGFFWGGLVLLTGGVVKEAKETDTIINVSAGINHIEALLTCTF